MRDGIPQWSRRLQWGMCTTAARILLALIPASSALAQLGPALAGRSAQAENAAIVNQNPAGLTRLPGAQLVVDTITALSLSEFDVDESKSDNAEGDPDNDPDIAVVPQVAASFAIGDFRLGFGLSVPQGFGTSYGNDWSGRYLADETSLVFISAQPAVAYRVNERLSVGGAVAIMYVASDVKQNVRNLLPGQADGRFELDVDGFTAGPVLSVLLEPQPTTRMGLTWRGEMEPELEGEPNFKNLGPLLENALDAAGLLGKNIDIKMRVPQMVQGGIYHEIDERLSVMADVTWLDWSRFGRVEFSIGSNSTTFNTDYNDIWVFSVGADYRFNERWSGGVGFSYISSGIDDGERSIGLPLDEFMIPGIGVKYLLNDTVALHSNFLVSVGGEGKVDQDAGSGRLVGRFDERVTFALQLSLVWGQRPN